MTTQTQAKNEFIELLLAVITETEKIDRATPWQPVEPQWWLEMMELQKQAYKAKKALKL